MGLIYVGAPAELVLELRKVFGIKTFVETGTYFGDTALWASQHFDKVVTIEASRNLYEQAAAKYSKIKNLEIRFGESTALMKDVLPGLDNTAIFWLDSHWCGGASYGEEKNQCPLLDEIKTLNASAQEHFILIDDARLFTSPPPFQHRAGDFPDISAVIDALRAGGKRRFIVIFEDVIIAVPEYARDQLMAYCQKKNTEVWDKHCKYVIMSPYDKGWQLIKQGLKMIYVESFLKIKGKEDSAKP